MNSKHLQETSIIVNHVVSNVSNDSHHVRSDFRRLCVTHFCEHANPHVFQAQSARPWRGVCWLGQQQTHNIFVFTPRLIAANHRLTIVDYEMANHRLTNVESSNH